MSTADRAAAEVMSLRSTVLTMMIADELSTSTWFLSAKKGNETLQFSVGQQVVTTGRGQMKAGIVLTVQAAYMTNGFARYFAGGLYHQAADLVAK